MAAKEEKSRIFRTLLQIYWPLLLVGGVQLGWTLAQGGFAALAADMAVFLFRLAAVLGDHTGRHPADSDGLADDPAVEEGAARPA